MMFARSLLGTSGIMNLGANSALSVAFAFCPIGIVWCIWMSVGTMCLATLSLRSYDTKLASFAIDLMRHKFKMCWIYATGSTAEMVNIQLMCSGSAKHFIGYSVRIFHAPVKVKHSITSWTTSSPKPTAGVGFG